MRTIHPNIDQLRGISHFIYEESNSLRISDEDHSFAQELISETGCKDSIDNIAYLIQIAREEKKHTDLKEPAQYDDEYIDKLEITPHQRAMLDMEYDELNRTKTGFHKDQETYSKLWNTVQSIESSDTAYFQKIRITINESNHFTFIQPSLISEIMEVIQKHHNSRTVQREDYKSISKLHQKINSPKVQIKGFKNKLHKYLKTYSDLGNDKCWYLLGRIFVHVDLCPQHSIEKFPPNQPDFDVDENYKTQEYSTYERWLTKRIQKFSSPSY